MKNFKIEKTWRITNKNKVCIGFSKEDNSRNSKHNDINIALTANLKKW